ncbi:MAG: DUF5320 domain-containing protein [Desulfobacterales bacterium]|nr:DUF5320 domain-containing protein [Desulfobacterales bacterium]
MPGFDGTGPVGQGPMTGGGFGYCGSSRRPGYGLGGRGFYGRFGPGRGLRFGRAGGMGFGLGYGYGRPWSPYWQTEALDPKVEITGLHREAEDLKAYLKQLEAKIAELEKT